MKCLLVFLAVVALAAAEFIDSTGTAETKRSAELFKRSIPLHEIDRRAAMWPFSSDPNDYACEIAPQVTFYPVDNTQPLPAYICTNGPIEVLIATRSFHLPHSPYEYATYSNLIIDPSILHIEYPGFFSPTPPSLEYKNSRGTPIYDHIEITGLLLLSENGVRRKGKILSFFSSSSWNCKFVPFVNFVNEHTGELPVYRCVRGSSEILIATDSFRNPYDQNEFSDSLDLTIDDSVIQVYYPGSFKQVSYNRFKSNPNLTNPGAQFYVQGLLRLTE